MAPETLALHAAVAVAGFFQSVTGVGFGMIAGPVILMVLDSASAVIVTTLLNWLVALTLLPLIWRSAHFPLGGRLIAGAILGMPLGVALLAAADVVSLKIGAALLIGSLTALMIIGGKSQQRPGWRGDLIMGGLGGVLGACLAVPGPTAAARMGALGLQKDALRATMLLFFAVMSVPVVAGQIAGLGFHRPTLLWAAMLAPATLAGLALGHLVAPHVSQRVFRLLVTGLLLATSASLFVNAMISVME